MKEFAQAEFQRKTGSYDFRDLFVYTSLRCNLACTHCFVSSSPQNRTLDEILLKDALPFFEEAEKLGVKDVYFTGGEPFANKEIIPMLDAALKVAPVTVYTNATKPLELKLDALAEAQKKHVNQAQLRVSIDNFDKDIHEVFYNRGKGSYAEAVANTVKAARKGFPVSITTQNDMHNGASEEIVRVWFTEMFKELGVELEDVKVLPNIPQGAYASRADTSRNSLVIPGEKIPEDIMCRIGRTIIKYDGVTRVFPCTILIPDKREAISQFQEYEMGRTLGESLKKIQPLNHPSCRAYCVQGKQTCANK